MNSNQNSNSNSNSNSNQIVKALLLKHVTNFLNEVKVIILNSNILTMLSEMAGGSSSNDSSSKKISPAVIGGIVGGVLAGLLLLALVYKYTRPNKEEDKLKIKKVKY